MLKYDSGVNVNHCLNKIIPFRLVIQIMLYQCSALGLRLILLIRKKDNKS